MATILLLIIYAVFIGLGIPDSSFGPAWPAIFPDFNVPVSFANFVEMTVSLGTITASFFSAKKAVIPSKVFFSMNKLPLLMMKEFPIFQQLSASGGNRLRFLWQTALLPLLMPRTVTRLP